MRPALPALLLALAVAPAPGRAVAPDAPPARGLAFAIALKGTGETLAAGPFLLKVPGGSGPLRLEVSGLVVEGARVRGEARLRNGSGLLLAGLELQFLSATPTRREDIGRATAAPVPVGLRAPIPFGDLLPGESTPGTPFELSPVPLGEEVALATILGAVSGLAVEAPAAVAGATRPVALDADRSGRLYVASAGVGRVLRFTLPSASSPAEAARPASPPAGIALRRRNGDLFVSTGGPLLEVHRPGRERPSTLDAGRNVKALRIDGKNVLWAAGGNAVLAFDEARPGPARALGGEGAEVVSFDVDPRGTVHAVLREGDARRVVVAGAAGPAPFRSGKGSGADALDAPTACRFDGEGSLWVSALPRDPEGTVLARFQADGTPLGALSRLALALLFGQDEESGVPAVVDLAPGPERRLHVLLENGSVFAIRPF